MKNERIRHMVIFCLKHEKDSVKAKKFLHDGEIILTSIPVVEKFEAMNQISSKNEYNYGFSMEFRDKVAYETYNTHSLHVDFVNNRWQKEVTKFLEIDFQI